LAGIVDYLVVDSLCGVIIPKRGILLCAVGFHAALHEIFERNFPK